ncbi:MAG: hypothetical protein HRT67_09100 [Flavobacteriaceae bacterium]|nr:hypothetical protein [Flavobacteriaceae bacterium]
MKKIVRHNTELLSIKSINNSVWEDKIIFKMLLKKIFVNNDNILATFKNLVYFHSNLQKRLLQIINYETFIKSNYDSCFSEISFYLKISNIDDKSLEIINELWTIYEQPSLLIYNENEDDKKLARKEKSIFLIPWKEITSTLDSIILFRGIEEDVLWIGKSKNKFLPCIETVINYKPKLR